MRPLHRLTPLLLLLVLSTTLLHARSSLHSGPYPGDVGTEHAALWYAHDGEAVFEIYLVDTALHRVHRPDTVIDVVRAGHHLVTARFEELRPDAVHRVVLTEDGTPIVREQFMRTMTTELRDLDILVGSCNFIGKGVTKLLFNTGRFRIHDVARSLAADLMLWLGDNVYYWGKDTKSGTHMVRRHLYYRSHPTLDALMRAQPNLAIWDDHDYGPNNAYGDYPLRDTARAVHKAFWPASSYGMDGEGIHSMVSMSDIDIFLLDNRSFSDTTAGVLLGDDQRRWLLDGLRRSDATFKLVCSGVQWFNEVSHGEAMRTLAGDEIEDVLATIRDEDIRGVVFLSGDRHYSSIERLELKPGHMVYDITSSPILSPANRMGVRKERDDNPNLLPNAIFAKRTVAQLSVRGVDGRRQIDVRFYDKRGEVVLHHVISEDQL